MIRVITDGDGVAAISILADAAGRMREVPPMLAMVIHRLRTRETFWAELGSGIAAILWSTLAIGFHVHLMDLTMMQVALTIADERTWQVLGMLLGVGQTLAVLFDRPVARWIAAGLASWFWLCLTGMLIAVASTPSIAVYFVLAALNAVPTIRLLGMRLASIP